MQMILDSEVFGSIAPFETRYSLKQLGYGASTPEVRTNYVDVPGKNGVLDLTSAMGPVTYNQREVWGCFREYAKAAGHISKYSEILNKYHGQRVKVVLDADPGYYYIGRCTISTDYTNENARLINVSVAADPFKYPVYASDEDWLWDPFNFETGVIRNYRNLVISGTRTVGIIGYEQPESPKFYVTLNSGQSSMRMVFDGNTYYLHNGMNSFPQIVISSQDVHTDINQFTFTGYGKVSVDMRGGIL